MAEVIHIRVNRTMCILSGSLLFHFAGVIHNHFGYKEGLSVFLQCHILYGDLGIVPEEYPCFFKNMAFRIYAPVLFHPALYFADLPPYWCTGRWQPDIIFFPFLLVWFNDTFAYLFGSKFGKHKLFSPYFALKNPGRNHRRRTHDTGRRIAYRSPISKVLSYIDTTVISANSHCIR